MDNIYKLAARIGAIIIGIAAMAACNNLDNATSPATSSVKIKSETKWLIDAATSRKLNVVSKKTYDCNGNIQSLNLFNDNGILNTKSVFSYSENKSVETTELFNEFGTIVNSSKIEYQLNDNGKIVKQIEYTGDGGIKTILTFNYDANGNVMKKTEFDSKIGKNVETDFKYVYDDDGCLVTRSTISDGRLRSLDSMAYVKDENKLQIINKSNRGEIVNIVTYLYNKQGLIFYETVSSPDGILLKKYLYEYEFFSN